MVNSKLTKEDKQFIIELKQKGLSLKEIQNVLQEQRGISVVPSTISRIKTVDSNDDTKSDIVFDPEEEAKTNITRKELNEGINIIVDEFNHVLDSGVEKQVNELNKDLSSTNSKLAELIQEAKKLKMNKPMKLHKRKIPLNLIDDEDLDDSERKERGTLKTKLRNYVDTFHDNEVIVGLCGDDPEEFKIQLNCKSTKELRMYYNEIQMGLNSKKDVEMFLHTFANTLKLTEFIFNLGLGLKLSNLTDEVLDIIDIQDLKMMACELSASRYISSSHRIMLTSVMVLLRKVIESNKWDESTTDLKIKLHGCYKSIRSFLGK